MARTAAAGAQSTILMRYHPRPMRVIACVTFGFASLLTAQTPVMLGDLAPGPTGSRPATYTLFGQLGQRTLFNANDGTGNEPWITDGTPAGTYRLADLYLGPTGSTPRDYTQIGSRAVFAAWLPGIGEELAVTDGTPGGTRILADLRPGLANGNPHGLVRFRDEVVFRADDGNGLRAWRTDGTPAGTFVHPVLPAHCVGGVVAGHRLFWMRANGTAHELWCWDGAAAPAVVTTFLGSAGAPRLAGAVRDRVVIVEPMWSMSASLWSSDGTAPGTIVVAANVPDPVAVATANDRLYWTTGGRTTTGWLSLWVGDGTAGTATLLTQLVATSSYLWSVGDRAFVQLMVPGPRTPVPLLCVSDGTVSGTQFAPLDVRDPIPVGARHTAFVASDAAHGAEVWLTDGTVAGTARATDVFPGPGSAFDALRLLIYQGGRLLFWADDGVHGRELFAAHLGAGVAALGSGCSDGAAPQLFADDPVLGGQVTLRGRSQIVAAPGFVALGLVAATPQIVLGVCDVQVDLGNAPLLLPCATDPVGDFGLPPLPVPADPALDGLRIAAQAALVRPSAPLLGLALSSGVLLTLGF